MFGFRVAKQTFISAFALFTSLSISPPARACMGCEMIKHPAIVLNFSPDGKILASSNSYRRGAQGIRFRTTIELWQVPKMKMVKQLQEGQGVIALAFSPNGKFLAAGGFGNWVSLWKMPEGKRVRQFMVKTQRYDGVRSLTFSPDGRLLAAGTRDGKIYLWQIPQGKLVDTLIADKGKTMTVASLAFSPDGKKLAVLVEDGCWFQLWDVRMKKLIWERKYEATCFSVAFTRNGRELVGAGYSLLVLSSVDGSIINQSSPIFYSPPGGVSADGQLLALCDYSGSVKVKRSQDFKDIWRTSIIGWKLKRQLHHWAEKIEQRMNLPLTKLFPRPILPFAFGVAFSRDNRRLALGFDTGQIKLWRVR